MADMRAIRRVTAACTLALSLTGVQAVGVAVADSGRNASPGSTQQPKPARTVVSPKPVRPAPTPVQAENLNLERELADNLKEQQQIRDEIQLYRSSVSGSNLPYAKLTALAFKLKSLQQGQRKLESLIQATRQDCGMCGEWDGF